MIQGEKNNHAVAVIALVLAAATANANDSPPPPVVVTPKLFDGRYYEVVIANKVTWDDARAAAESRTHDGIQGQLATIGSLGEDAFVQQLYLAAVHDGTELWVGGYQVKCATSTPEPGCGWVWINGEAIAAANTTSPYTHWLPGEPNNLKRKADVFNRATEDHLAIGLDGAFGWNDEGNRAQIRGYVVEYGDKVTIPAAACTADGPGCNPTGAQVLQYPSTAKVDKGATLTARTFIFKDDPARCGNSPLSLFDGAVVLPAYLCGHPDFLVIETQSVGVVVTTGAIRVENLTEDALPDNLYGCDKVRQNPSGAIDPDPTHRDVVAWQSANAADMPETTFGSGRYFGTITEVTYGCGSSRGIVLEGSYHFVGLRIHPGAGNEFATNKPGNLQSLTALTAYKLDLLHTSVVASKAALPKFNYVALKALIDGAIYFHDRGKYKAALLNIKLFLYAVERTKYKSLPGQNFNGDHLMRGSNLEFMYTRKIVPYAP